MFLYGTMPFFAWMSHYRFAGVAAPFFLRVRTAMTMHRTDGPRALLAGALPRLHSKAPILRPHLSGIFPLCFTHFTDFAASGLVCVTCILPPGSFV